MNCFGTGPWSDVVTIYAALSMLAFPIFVLHEWQVHRRKP